MKRRLLFFLSLHLFASVCPAQLPVSIPAYGKIEVADLEMTDCSFAPGAEAVNLLKFEEVILSVFPNNTTEVFIKTRCRVKILRKSAFKYATVSINYNNSVSKIADMRGATYNLDGKGEIVTTPLGRSDIYKTDNSRKNKTISFTFPDVKEGSIIEYEFTRKNKHSFYIPAWYFQNSIPNVLSVCSVSRPHYSLLQKKVVGDWTLEQDSTIDYTKGNDDRQLVNYYAMRNVPAFVWEPFMSSSKDYRYHIDFLTASRESAFDAFVRQSDNIWQGDNLWLLRHPYFGEQFGAAIPGTKKFIDSVKRLQDNTQRIAAVYSFVKRKVRWNGYYFPLSRDLEDVFEEGEGFSGEINLGILNLLRKCNVMCFPVLYSTRSHGKVDYDFVNLSQFNTVNIAVVNGKKFNLLDGTNPYLSYDTPPLTVVNRTGMLIDPVNHTRINIDFNRKLIWDSVFVSASIDSNGMLKGKIVKKYFDLAKSLKLQNDVEEDDDESDAENEPVSAGEITIDSSFQNGKEDDLLPLTETTIFHYELPSTNEYYFLDPFLFSSVSKNPFVNNNRKTDIDFGANTASVVQIEVVLPVDLTAEELAANRTLRMADSSIIFKYHNEIKNNTVFISSEFDINEPVFEKEVYVDIKEFFKNIYGTLSNQVLLKKK